MVLTQEERDRNERERPFEEARKREREQEEWNKNTCQKCGKYDPKAEEYCKFCGAANTTIINQNEKDRRKKQLGERMCRRCGSYVGNSKFCSECGEKMPN